MKIETLRQMAESALNSLQGLDVYFRWERVDNDKDGISLRRAVQEISQLRDFLEQTESQGGITLFRDDEFFSDLSPDDRVEIFRTILLGGSDITPELLNSVISDYQVEGIGAVRVCKNCLTCLLGEREEEADDFCGTYCQEQYKQEQYD